MEPDQQDKGRAQEAAAVWAVEDAVAEVASRWDRAATASARVADTPWRTRSEFPVARPSARSAASR
jgi:hypothetical protein